jgi:hypothetical protein
MNRLIRCAVVLGSASLGAGVALAPSPAAAQTKETPAERNATREQLRALLASVGPHSDVGIAFRQSTQNPYNFVGSATGLANSDSLEVVVSVTEFKTLSFRIYPHYHGGYINIGRAKHPAGLMKKLLGYSDNNFLFFGTDKTDDVFAGYTFTLESGFPAEAVTIVLRSLRNQDKYVGEMRPLIDGK